MRRWRLLLAGLRRRRRSALLWAVGILLFGAQVGGFVAAVESGRGGGSSRTRRGQATAVSRSGTPAGTAIPTAADSERAVIPVSTAGPAALTADAPPSAPALPHHEARLQTAAVAVQRAFNAFYLVQPGDGLFSVAERLGVSPFDLATANRLPPTSWLLVGQVLRVPEGADTELPQK